MDLLKPIKAVVNKVKDKLESAQNEIEQKKKLSKWKKKLDASKNNVNLDLFDEREAIYLGTRDVDANVNSNQKPSRKANNIYNIAYEMVEAQISSTIPQPSVKSKRDGFDEQAHMIEDSIGNDLREIGIEEINDINERITPVQGFSVITVDWDPDFKHHLYRGELKINSKHPKQLVTQPKVYHIQKMDYFFVLSSVTKDYIKRRYNVDIDDNEKEQFPEVNSLLTVEGTPSSEDTLVTEIVCWYRDNDGDVGKFVWCNETELEDLPKYFYRRLQRCTKCNAIKGVEDVCQVCGNTHFKESIEENETLTEDKTLHDGTTVPAGTEVPYFVPTRYPISVRINVPKSFSFGGQSDIDVLRDQQDSIKKVGTKVEEKVIKGGSVITVPDDLNFNPTNETYQVVKANAAQAAAITVRDMKADISQDLNFIEQQRRTVQYMLGITNSFQGLEDNTAKSGVAKQIAVQQASGRMKSKEFNKYTAFKELFEIIFEFKLALYDELRPYLSTDQNGNDKYGEFDKYKFLCRDDSGQLYYNTDFIFSADAGAGIPKDPIFVFNQAQTMFQSGALDQMQYWLILESLNFPQAGEIKKQLEERMQQNELGKAQNLLNALKGLSPQERESFFNVPEQAQAQMIQAIMSQGQGQQPQAQNVAPAPGGMQ